MKKYIAIASAIIVSTGLVVATHFANAQSKQPIDITADSLEVRQDQGYAIFRDNVQVSQGKLTLGSQELEVFYSNKGDGEEKSKDGIAKIIASGGITVTFGADTATAEKAVYDPNLATVELTGDVVLVRAGATAKGTKLTYDLDNGKVSLSGGSKQRVKMRLVPSQVK